MVNWPSRERNREHAEHEHEQERVSHRGSSFSNVQRPPTRR
jgi:hypothetical protein